MQAPEFPRISDYLAHYAARYPEREFLAHPDRRLGYAAARCEVDACARALMASGVQPGDRVAALGTPRPEYFIIFLAAASIGAIWLGLNPKYTPFELDHVVTDSDPVLVFGLLDPGDDAQAATLAAIKSAVPSIRGLVVRGGAIADLARGYADWLVLGAGVSDDDLATRREGVQPSDPAALVYTSGTTGRPKGALLPHRGLAYCGVVQADHWYEPAPRKLCDLPISHVGCLGDISAAILVAGGTIVFMDRFSPTGVLETIARERVEYWLAVPTMFTLTMRTDDWAHADLSSLKRVFWGGAAAPEFMVREFRRRNIRIGTSYGQTEVVGSMTYTADDDDLPTLLTTVGRPDPRFDVHVMNLDGSFCSIGEQGEIVVRGDFVMNGYLHCPDATARTIDAQGWLHTGDVAVAQEDGNLRLVGRLSDMFKSGGYNVYPREIELALEQHPAVALAAVIAHPDELWGEVGRAYVVLRSGARAEVGELRQFARVHLANYKVPKSFVVTDTLPMLAVGKVDKRQLQQAYATI